MRWEFGRRSDNVEDRRGSGVPGGVVVGGGIGTILLALVVTLLGGDPSVILKQAAPANNAPANAPRKTSPQEEKQVQFVSTILADTEDVWNQEFQQLGRTYQEPKLVLFSGAINSACGLAQSAMGPFYCPRDQKVYIDLSFYRDLQTNLNAPGDFAQAYVIAHEVGHHVQNQLGILSKVTRAQQQTSQVTANKLQVMVELQADCLAGVWANHAERSRQILEQGDVEEALNAASQIGDDRLQEKAKGYAVPDSFTHGSSEQRMRWFSRGIKTGQIAQCDTFSVSRL